MLSPNNIHLQGKRTLRLLACALITAAVLTSALFYSCGRKKTATLTPIKITITPIITYAPLFIAAEEGYFEAQGLQVEFIRLNQTAEAIPSLDRGDLDIVGGSVSMSVLNAISRGARIRIVADKGSEPPSGCTSNGFVIRRELASKVNVEQPGSLKGLKVAVNPVSTSGYILEKILGEAGLTLDDVTVTHIPASILPEALKNGSVDLAEVDEPFLSNIIESGSSVIWFGPDKYYSGHQIAVLLFGPNLLDKNPDAGERFMTAYLQAIQKFKEGKTERNLDILSKMTNLDKTQLRKMCWPFFRENGEPLLESLMDYQQWGVRKGLLKAQLSTDQIWDGRFVEAARRNLAAQVR